MSVAAKAASGKKFTTSTTTPSRAARARARTKSRGNTRPIMMRRQNTHTPTLDGVLRRADSCIHVSNPLRHRVRSRRKLRQWENIGASGRLLDWICNNIHLPFRYGRLPPAFTHGISILDVAPTQFAYLESELDQLVQEGH